ncbi:MAG: hypothetical protein AB1705_02380 [Verrucomicrobiota bacterium]
MKTKVGGFLWVLATTLFLATFARAAEVTAFDLVKEGNRYIGEQSKDRVVQIRSDKSVGGITPNIWYVVYYDETASLKAVEVKFGGGKMMDVKRPLRLLEPIRDRHLELNRKQLKVDSDDALKKALKEPILEKLTIKATSMKLENSDNGPVWKIKLWAAKLKQPTRDVDIGEIHLAAEDGKVVKLDVHIDRVD